MCNTNAAYAQGVNDAKNHQNMKTNYASLCSADADTINASYQKGYTTGLKDQSSSLPQSTYQCQTPYTKEICGYDCIKDPYNHVYCGLTRGDICVEDNFHTIRCGLNCHVNNMGKVECDKERYSATSDHPF